MKTHRLTLIASFSIVLSLFALFSAERIQAAVTLQDSTFNNSDWTAVLLQPPSTFGASFTAASDAAGNPAQSRKTHQDCPAGGDVMVVHSYQKTSPNNPYDPATQGAITHVSYSYDAKNLSDGNVAYALAATQNNVSYVVNLPEDYSTSSWQTFNKTNLTAADFVDIDTKKNHPDFSCQGKPIVFGYRTRNHSSGPEYTTDSLIDNWKVTIESAPCNCATIVDPHVNCDQNVYTYTFTLKNNTNHSIEWLFFSPPAGATYSVTPSAMHLTNPIAPGNQSNVTLTLHNVAAGDHVCLNVALADADLVNCCTVQTCFDVRCPCLKVIDKSLSCASGGLPTLTINVQNLTNAAMQPIFIVPVSPASLTINQPPATTSIAAHGTTSISVNLGGATPGDTVCVRIVPFSTDAQCCTSEPICLNPYPLCHHGPPGPPLPPPTQQKKKEPKK